MQNQEQVEQDVAYVLLDRAHKDIEDLRSAISSILELAKVQERAGDKVCTVGKSTLRILQKVLSDTE